MRRITPSRLVVLAILAVATRSGELLATDLQSEVSSLESEVSSLLERACARCHGERKQAASLRVDSREGLLEGGDAGAAIVPGDPASSLLLTVVRGEHAQIPRMPKGKEPLSEEEIALLERWIRGGARWSAGAEAAASAAEPDGPHWAFTAPRRPPLPAVDDEAWCRNPIDRFILSRLEREGLPPSPAADPGTLLRRVWLDLVGLPPGLDAVDGVPGLDDRAAWESLVEELLTSPHHGEKWGRHWLDAARYADSDGYEKDKSRVVWFYRDWVIEALSVDMPYDRFIVEQIAGDLLPEAGPAQVVATGFLRNSMTNEEGGVDPEQFRMEALFDRMDAIGKSVLGLTIQCGQCHDHKFDPLTQVEYYRLFAFLNNAHEASVVVHTDEEEARVRSIAREIESIEDGLRRNTPGWEERFARWQEEASGRAVEWTVVRPEVDELSTGGQKYLLAEDGSFLAQGYAPTKHTVRMTVESPLQEVRALRLELLRDPNLPAGGPGRSIFGTAALTEISVEVARRDAPNERRPAKIASAVADVDPEPAPLHAVYSDRSDRERLTGPVEFAIDGKDETAWSHDLGPGRRNRDAHAVFVLAEPIREPGGAVLTFHLRQNHGGWNSDDNQSHNLGRFRLSVTDAPAASEDTLTRPAREALARPPEERSSQERALLFSTWRATVPEWKDANARIEALWRSHPEGTTQLALLERDEPRMTSVLRRGDFLRPGRTVEPGTPEFLHSMPADAPRSRLGFARWLVDRRAPTTARAAVNRIWQAYFGIGLVETVEDLGRQSPPPSHPALLDWLAVELMESGWSLRRIHRLIVDSATYRQSSRLSAALLERDPRNRLLARAPRLRVDGEIVRDIALAASGLLDRTVGGPSVHPPLPAFLLQPPVSYGPKVWQESLGGDRYRRALYTFQYRSLPYPSLQVFDVPNGDTSCVRRSRSNTPLQALTTLNEPLFVECAVALARRARAYAGGSDRARLRHGFRLCAARSPTDRELDVLLGLLERERERQHSVPAPEQEALLGASDDEPRELAAWTVVARVILNLDETITKE